MTDTSQLPPVEKARSPLSEAWEMFRGNHAAMAGLVILIIIILGAIFGPMLYSTDPFDMVWAPFSPPGQDGFLFGTDYLGRDLLAQILAGGRVTLIIGLSAAILTVVIGVTVGALAGFYGSPSSFRCCRRFCSPW